MSLRSSIACCVAIGIGLAAIPVGAAAGTGAATPLARPAASTDLWSADTPPFQPRQASSARPEARATSKGPRTLTVPSKATPTLAAAVKKIRSNGIIRLLPGTRSGSVTVTNKTVRIVGAAPALGTTANRSVLRSASRTKPVIRFGKNGGGTIERVTLRGGNIGVAGTYSKADQSAGSIPTSISLKSVKITNVKHGIYGRFGNLLVENIDISGVAYGTVILGAKKVNLFGGQISNCAGTGVLIFNTVPSALYVIDNVTLNDNQRGGVRVYGNKGLAIVSNITALRNYGEALLLWNADHTIIKGSRLADTRNSTDSISVGESVGSRRNGVSMVSSDGVLITGNQLSGAFGGLVNAGGIGVGFGDNTLFNNEYHVVAVDLGGVFGTYSDMGGNSCGFGDPTNPSAACSVYSPGGLMSVPDAPVDVPNP
ncbi:MAG: right-handed parallel beta-helix repeat-containing protein [Actinomycetes bacterium]